MDHSDLGARQGSSEALSEPLSAPEARAQPVSMDEPPRPLERLRMAQSILLKLDLRSLWGFGKIYVWRKREPCRTISRNHIVRVASMRLRRSWLIGLPSMLPGGGWMARWQPLTLKNAATKVEAHNDPRTR